MLGDDLPWNDDAMVCAGGRSTDACQVEFSNYNKNEYNKELRFGTLGVQQRIL